MCGKRTSARARCPKTCGDRFVSPACRAKRTERQRPRLPCKAGPQHSCASAPCQPERRRDGVLPRGRLRTVVAYIEEHLDAGLTLEQMAAAARLSVYHFARQFKAATGLPPHQYVIMRRVERARQLLQAGTDLSLAEVAAHAGFSDQSQFTHHFKRLVGVTPGQFRTPAKIA